MDFRMMFVLFPAFHMETYNQPTNQGINFPFITAILTKFQIM